ncbi:MAG: EamA family transporter [Candidatus Tumulicola sp.]
MLLGGAQLAVGAAAIFARFALEGAGPLAVAATRLAIAAFVLLAIAAVRYRLQGSRARPTRRQAATLAAAGVALAVHFGGWIASLEYTTVAASTLLVATTPIWTALYDAIFRRQVLSRAALVAFVTGGLGVSAIVGFNATPPPVGGHLLLGAALAVLGSVGMAVYLILVRDVRSSLGTRAVVTRTYAWAAIVLIAAAAIARQSPPNLADGAAWGGIVAMALISQLLGHTAINASLRWFSPSAVSFANLIEPIAAGLLALAIFGEALSPAAVAGGIVLLGSIAVVLREDRGSNVADESL